VYSGSQGGPPDCGCHMLTTICCSCAGAGRVGNMIVLKQNKETQEFMFITYPLIFIVSIFVAVKIVPEQHPAVTVLWFFATFFVCAALFFTGCRDPGILKRRAEQPDASWRWNDQAQTYRPIDSSYDHECGVIVEDFDHVSSERIIFAT
jgi:hypothetical protein